MARPTPPPPPPRGWRGDPAPRHDDRHLRDDTVADGTYDEWTDQDTEPLARRERMRTVGRALGRGARATGRGTARAIGQ
ncbi:MAG TPA: hypothetical protein PKH97_07190, partial [Tetrasphaera sp.]|uniref:hypothetical protein n=1 Tax=Nostocoides sp. TaxID=1917966 RepID=UPI002BB26D00